jgi:hypothetical protein
MTPEEYMFRHKTDQQWFAIKYGFYPHECPHCKQPSYNSLDKIDCSNSSCPECEPLDKWDEEQFRQQYAKHAKKEINLKDYPHDCTVCKKPAYIDFMDKVHCSNSSCQFADTK